MQDDRQNIYIVTCYCGPIFIYYLDSRNIYFYCASLCMIYL